MKLYALIERVLDTDSAYESSIIGIYSTEAKAKKAMQLEFKNDKTLCPKKDWNVDKYDSGYTFEHNEINAFIEVSIEEYNLDNEEE